MSMDWEFDRNITIFPDAALTLAEDHRSNGLKKTEKDRCQVLTMFSFLKDNSRLLSDSKSILKLFPA